MKIAQDKWKHFYVGIVMGIVLQAAAAWLLPSLLWAVIASLAGSIAIAYGFELFSLYTGKGHYEVMDAIASVLGAIPGIAMAWTYQYYA
ncbi:hypothetical protein [uncultured Chitinophaga sp.]|uniref:hypothetical protein n=1 Tax=uncultured Chitinophaga sp. TaxID=339340 RepID=UPI0025F3BC55|nr:hypothetical protein [uncultured Chitinophaga sp.]